VADICPDHGQHLATLTLSVTQVIGLAGCASMQLNCIAAQTASCRVQQQSLLGQTSGEEQNSTFAAACRMWQQVAEMHPVRRSVEVRRHPAESVRTAAMQDVVMWLCGNDPLGAGLPISNTGSSAVPGLFASLEDLARGDAALVGD